MSRAEAEPPADRNAAPPTVDEVLQFHWDSMPEGAEGLGDLLHFVQGNASAGAGGYGVRPGRGMGQSGRRAAAILGPTVPPTPRPQTGHIMLFPLAPPIDALGGVGPLAGFEVGPAVPPEIMRAALEEGMDQARTLDQLMAMQALPVDAIQALMNIPNYPISQWHALRQRTTEGSRRPPHPRSADRSVRTRQG